MIWDLPFSTHTRFLEPLSPVPHLDAVLSGRHIGFLQGLLCSKKSLIRLIFSSSCQDQQAATGQNLQYLKQKYKKQTLLSLASEKNRIKNTGIYPLSNDETWKLGLLEEISLVKKEHLELEFDADHLEEILELICSE